MKHFVHKALLEKHSRYFRKALNGSWKEGEDKVVCLDDVDCTTCKFIPVVALGGGSILTLLQLRSSLTGCTPANFQPVPESGTRKSSEMTSTLSQKLTGTPPRSLRCSSRTLSPTACSHRIYVKL